MQSPPHQASENASVRVRVHPDMSEYDDTEEIELLSSALEGKTEFSKGVSCRTDDVDSQLEKTKTESTCTWSFRGDIESLRAIAFAEVFLYHLYQDQFPGGFLGVDVFFTISGFVVTGRILRDEHLGKQFSPLEFYSARCRRLVPASGTVVCIVLIVFYCYGIVVTSWEEHGATMEVLSAASGFSNIYLYLDSQKYDPTTETSPFLHYWSLAVEEQFYLLVAILIFVTRDNIAFRFSVITLCTIASSILYTGVESPDFTFFMMPSRFFQIGVGSIIAQLVFYKYMVLPKVGMGILKLISLVGIFLLPWVRHHAIEPGLSTFGAVAATGLFLCIEGDSTTQILEDCSPLRYVGKVSYAAYLVHWPILILYRELYGGSTGAAYLVYNLVYVVIGTWLLATFVEHAIPKLELAKKQPFWLGLGLYIASCSMAVVLAILLVSPDVEQPSSINSSTRGSTIHTLTPLPPLPPLPLNSFYCNSTLAIGTSAVAWSLNQTQMEITTDKTQAQLGTPGYTERAFAELYPARENIIVLAGDSHAMSTYPALTLLAQKWNASLWIFCKPGGPSPQIYFSQGRKAVATPAKIHDLITNSQKRFLGIFFVNAYGTEKYTLLPNWIDLIKEAVGLFKNRAFYLSDVMPLAKDTFMDAKLGKQGKYVFANTLNDIRSREISSAIGKAFFDIRPVLCANGICPSLVNNSLVYGDNVGHLTRGSANFFAPFFASTIDCSSRWKTIIEEEGLLI